MSIHRKRCNPQDIEERNERRSKTKRSEETSQSQYQKEFANIIETTKTEHDVLNDESVESVLAGGRISPQQVKGCNSASDPFWDFFFLFK